MLAVRLPPKMEKRLDSLAKKTGRTKSYYVRQALAETFEDMEDACLAEKSWEEVRAGGRLYTLEEVKVQLGLK